jgi:nitrogen fixation/metabolism regulation signal transduction histidine kinase
MPPSIYQNMKAGEAMSAVENRRLGRREYVVAYRRLPAGTLAVPVPVIGGEAAIRQRELADLLLFVVLLGGALSLALSVAVGRALARPIGQLRRASAAVGGGRLSVRLPETDAGEFGELFGSFNRMARRLRRARAQEVQAARVLAWGEMSRQVAHEIKNPLTPIKLSVQHLRRAYADGRSDYGEILESNVEQILTEIDRLTEIARVFSRYGAPAEAAGPLEAVAVAPVVNEALMLYRAGELGIQYRAELEEALPPVSARAGELKEVLLNLLENAYTALDNRGTVTIEARRDGERVEVVVRDDGPGIPSELLPKIFEPHFSTHSTGTGLGLAIVRRIVEDWGGTVNAESGAGGEGTAVTIRLLVAEREREELRVP